MGAIKIVIVRKTVPGTWDINKLAALIKYNIVIDLGGRVTYDTNVTYML